MRPWKRNSSLPSSVHIHHVCNDGASSLQCLAQHRKSIRGFTRPLSATSDFLHALSLIAKHHPSKSDHSAAHKFKFMRCKALEYHHLVSLQFIPKLCLPLLSNFLISPLSIQPIVLCCLFSIEFDGTYTYTVSLEKWHPRYMMARSQSRRSTPSPTELGAGAFQTIWHRRPAVWPWIWPSTREILSMQKAKSNYSTSFEQVLRGSPCSCRGGGLPSDASKLKILLYRRTRSSRQMWTFHTYIHRSSNPKSVSSIDPEGVSNHVDRATSAVDREAEGGKRSGRMSPISSLKRSLLDSLISLLTTT